MNGPKTVGSISTVLSQISPFIPDKDLNRMAYGELYKGTFKKYRKTSNRQLELSDNMKARDLQTQLWIDKKSSDFENFEQKLLKDLI